MRRKDDILWKVVIEEVFDDLLRFIYADADQVYDLERGFEFLEKELAEMDPEPGEGSDTKFADKLVKVYHRDGEEEWVLMHVEIQGETANRTEFSGRMFRYFYRILDRFKRPVSAVAIFTGRDGRRMPGIFEYRYRGTRVLYEYQVLSILDFSDEELEESRNPFALVVLAAKMALMAGRVPERELLERKVAIGVGLMRKGFSVQKVRAIFRFLENTVLFENREMNRNFKERIQSHDKSNVMGIDEYVRQEGFEIGIEEGIEKGRQEAQRVIVANLLAGTEFSDDKIASLANVSVEVVEQVRQGIN
ncbi:MAG TPA: hypothetical protein VG101_05565 [Puia sp.]|jgi:hypothetical protein|nr:hypothetical protein [Puia sp.]